MKEAQFFTILNTICRNGKKDYIGLVGKNWKEENRRKE
jgi:hypothetical protein